MIPPNDVPTIIPDKPFSFINMRYITNTYLCNRQPTPNTTITSSTITPTDMTTIISVGSVSDDLPLSGGETVPTINIYINILYRHNNIFLKL
jgi:hypothetical protein